MQTKAELIRTDGSVLVGVRDPNAVLDVPAIERHYSDWANIAYQIASDVEQATPEILPTETIEQPPIAQDKPVSLSLAGLLAEVDVILYPSQRVNTSKEICGHHYTGHPKRDATNWESPAVKAWQAERQKKSDELIKCRHQRNGGAAC